MVLRKEYFDRLAGYRDKQIIKVVTGIRRCGKSTLLAMFQESLLGDGVDEEQIISVNFEDYEYEELLDPKRLYQYIKDRLIPKKKNYIFLDEIQNVRDFQKVVDSFFIKDNVDLYITGSNAYLLSGELATLLTGRYVKIEMLPLSFYEFMQAEGEESSLDELYRRYTETSSFPYVLNMDREKGQVRDYLSGIYDTIVLKDVVARKKISDVMMLESILRFLMDNIGNQLSTKKISDAMTSNGRGINVRTVESYLSSFMETYIVYQAKRYDIKGRQYLKTLEKYYIADIGLRNVMLGKTGTDVGRILENVMYLEFIRRGYDVYVGKFDSMEVDFVLGSEDGKKYVQVAASTRDEATLKRELQSLQKIPDHYPKVILTLDNDPIADYDGIRRMNALEYLAHKTDF